MKTNNKIVIGGTLVAVIIALMYFKNKKTSVSVAESAIMPTAENPKPSIETALNNSLIAPIDKSAQLAEQARLAEEAKLAEQRRLNAIAMEKLAESNRIAREARIAEQARLAKLDELALQARLAELDRLEKMAQSALAEKARLEKARLLMIEQENLSLEQARLLVIKQAIEDAKILAIQNSISSNPISGSAVGGGGGGGTTSGVVKGIVKPRQML